MKSRVKMKKCNKHLQAREKIILCENLVFRVIFWKKLERNSENNLKYRKAIYSPAA